MATTTPSQLPALAFAGIPPPPPKMSPAAASDEDVGAALAPGQVVMDTTMLAPYCFANPWWMQLEGLHCAEPATNVDEQHLLYRLKAMRISPVRCMENPCCNKGKWKFELFDASDGVGEEVWQKAIFDEGGCGKKVTFTTFDKTTNADYLQTIMEKDADCCDKPYNHQVGEFANPTHR